MSKSTAVTGMATASVLLLCALATSVSAIEAIGVTATQPAALPDWLVVGPPPPAAEVSTAWEGVTASAMPYLDATPSVSEMAARRSQGPATLPAFVEFTIADGPYGGHWRFHARDGARTPHAAWQLVLSGAPPYRVTARLYCDEAAGDCEPLRYELAQILPPRPTTEATMSDWLDIITDGPCEPGPVHMPAPAFPSRALRHATGGTVRVLVAFNGCGNVRYASVYQSSRHRDLDRAAVEAARAWRVAPPAGTSGPGQAVVGVSFDIADDDAPAH